MNMFAWVMGLKTISPATAAEDGPVLWQHQTDRSSIMGRILSVILPAITPEQLLAILEEIRRENLTLGDNTQPTKNKRELQ